MTALQMEKTGKAPVDPTPWALENLPPFPTVATRLLSVLSKEDVDTREVAQIVSAEPVFATRVLQMANSPLFSIQQQVKAIPHAIVLLGLARVRAITVTRAMGDFVAPAINLKILRTCWQNSRQARFWLKSSLEPAVWTPTLRTSPRWFAISAVWR